MKIRWLSSLEGNHDRECGKEVGYQRGDCGTHCPISGNQKQVQQYIDYETNKRPVKRQPLQTLISQILAAGNTVSDVAQLVSPDTGSRIEDLFSEFFNDPSMSVEDVQSYFVDIIADAQ